MATVTVRVRVGVRLRLRLRLSGAAAHPPRSFGGCYFWWLLPPWLLLVTYRIRPSGGWGG